MGSATKRRVPTVANMESMNDADDFDFHQAKAEKPRKPRMVEEDGTFSGRARTGHRYQEWPQQRR